MEAIQNKPELLQTPRLRLQPLREQDREAILSLLTNEQVGLTYMVPDFTSYEEQLAFSDRLISLCPDRFIYGIYRQDQLIGLLNEVQVSELCMELGYAIHPDHKNNGYATEALAAAMDTLFAMGYRTVIAGAFAENTASIRVMEKCGMHRLPQTEEVTYRGRLHPCVLFSGGKESP